MSNRAPVVSIRDIRKVYRTGDIEVHAVRGVSLEIQNGEFVALMGASGSGKSTLMNLFGCLDRPTSGTFLLDGVDVSALDRNERADIRNQKIGFVFQGFNLLARTTALENVELPMLYAHTRIRSREMRERALRALEIVGLADRADHTPSQLSGGQQQRVAIARALARQPQALLLDEPFSAVDRAMREVLYGEIAALRAYLNMPVILVTHDIDEARRLADRMVVIEHGGMLRHGGAAEAMFKGGATTL